MLTSDGTNWLIVGGMPNNENKYGALTTRAFGSEFEPSAARPTGVALLMEGTETGSTTVQVGGVEIARFQWTTGTLTKASYYFECPAGQKWRVNVSGGGTTLLQSSYRGL